MRRGFFITGTDTGVGKTVVCAAMLHRYRDTTSLRYWKPVQTGIEQDDDTATVRRLGAGAEAEIFDAGIRLPGAVSPHLAAERAGIRIDVPELLQAATSEAAGPAWIVEGAGGVLVPVNESELMVDLIARLDLPAVVVARSTVGTINHTLLTLHLLRSRALPVAAVVLVGPPDADNRRAIERFGKIAVVAEMPPLEPLEPDTLAAWARADFDPDNQMTPLLK